MTRFLALLISLALASRADLPAKEFHVAKTGDNANRGTRSAPLFTIQRAADLAQPGDTITVHEGIYRERINPPRGGTSSRKQIAYQAAPGEQVEIRGSERIHDWERVQEHVWKVTLPNTFFGGFNPYRDEIRGDWFDGKGRAHHTGAVYLNGDWLIEAVSLEEVLGIRPPAWLRGSAGDYLLNVAWLRPVSDASAPIPAASFVAQEGIQNAPCSEGGECIGWIEDGDWVRYAAVDLGKAEALEIRAASPGEGGVIEIRLGSPEGALIGNCAVKNTGDWQKWASFRAAIKPVTSTNDLCLVFRAHAAKAADPAWAAMQLWFAQVDQTNTTIYAQFKGFNPNVEEVEINVRQTVFYPDKPGRNYLTVRGFRMRHAATPWAPPTAEQVGLIGTHWSKGWVIENNVISHSVCSGIALGKHGDQWDNTSANTAEGYVKTIERGLVNGWSREHIGHHTVRNNTISHCEQTAIVGSLGAAFCTVRDNTIHDIHVRRLFTGAEMAGIKFHGAIDTVIRGNRIYRTCLGLWLDWMAQGTRVSGNLFHDNGRDLFMEVDHGPYVVDNNLFLSGANLLDMSEGGAYAHNLFAGRLTSRPEPNRETPYHPAHATTMAGLSITRGGDNRFYGNLFFGGAQTSPEFGLADYNEREYPVYTGGNVYYGNARPYREETNCVQSASDPALKLAGDEQRPVLEFTPGPELKAARTRLVTTRLLSKAKVPNLPYEKADGSALVIDRDFFGNKRSKAHPTPGPFEKTGAGRIELEHLVSPGGTGRK